MKKLQLKFDDIVKDEHGTWSQVCECCTDILSIDKSLLDENAGTGICGVTDCENEAVHYLDFK